MKELPIQGCVLVREPGHRRKSMNLRMVAIHAVAAAGLAGVTFGQSASKRLEFEVASIKPHPPGENSSSNNLVSGGMNATNVTLRQMILRAYDIQDFQLVGGPTW